MTEILNAIVLGIIQGLTEFLPVSSSGHLEIGKYILGESAVGEKSLLFTVVLHFATALSTLVVYRKDVAGMAVETFQRPWNESQRFLLLIVISMIPAVFAGLFWEEWIESLFSQNLVLVGSMLIVTALLLFVADRAKSTQRGVRWLDALIIGLAQAVAILPGISRSGATISTSVLLGIDRERAARFSFLMVVPLIFGKVAKDLMEGDLSYADNNFVQLIVGFAAAFVAGLFACTWMIRLVKASRLYYFSIYCLLVGLIAIIYQQL